MSYVLTRDEEDSLTGVTLGRAYGPFSERNQAWAWHCRHASDAGVTNTRVVPLVHPKKVRKHGQTTHFAKNGNEMPAWWSPEQRNAFAVGTERFPFDPTYGDLHGIDDDAEHKAHGDYLDALERLGESADGGVVAADLETGAEVPA